MYCLHEALIYAQKAGKILSVPPFPEKRRYGIEPTIIDAVSEDRQVKIIQAIPIEHQPIFWWLKYHFRRPSEAMALHKEDYDREKDCFIIRRSFSNKQLVQHTKTHKIHIVPCNPDFNLWTEKINLYVSPYYFTHQTRRSGNTKIRTSIIAKAELTYHFSTIFQVDTCLRFLYSAPGSA